MNRIWMRLSRDERWLLTAGVVRLRHATATPSGGSAPGIPNLG